MTQDEEIKDIGTEIVLTCSITCCCDRSNMAS